MSTTVDTTVAAQMPLAPLYPSSHWFWGSLGEFDRDELGTMMRAADQLGDTVRFRFANMTGVLVRNPDDVHRVLTENARNYSKRTFTYDTLSLLLGKGLVTSDGDFWLRQRRIAQPGFSRERVNAFAQLMVRDALETATKLQAAAAQGKEVEVVGEMGRLALRIAGETLLGRDLSQAADDVGTALQSAMHYIDRRISNPLMLPAWVPTKASRDFNASLRSLRGLTAHIIQERRASASPQPDLLQMLMDARDPETGSGMTDAQLEDEVLTMLLAGHETTAMTLSWTFWLLAQHVDVARRVRTELEDVLHGALPSLEDVSRLPYLEAVLRESMRLMPPVWVVERMAEGDDVLGGFKVEKGTFILVSPYVTHRSAAVWDNPEAFDPERFVGVDVKKLPKGAYIPFSAGQRKCIGEHFANLELMLVLATLLPRVQLSMVPGHPVVPLPLVTMRPAQGLRMHVKIPSAAKSTKVGAALVDKDAAVGCPVHA